MIRFGPYRTVYADPPWPEKGMGSILRGANRHYPLMKVAEIASLPVSEIADVDAHLYLWTTNNYLPDALKVMREWGFRYITTVTWLKVGFGLGQYFRGNTEHCLFGVRGRTQFQLDANGKRAQGVTGFTHPRLKRHSQKPEVMRSMIERVSPGPYIELFARTAAPGWDAWGNEPLEPCVGTKHGGFIAMDDSCRVSGDLVGVR